MTAKFQPSSDAERKRYAHRMAVKGYTPKIIALHTGLSPKQVKTLCKRLEESGLEVMAPSHNRSTRTGATLLRNHTLRMHASIFMGLYRKIGGSSVELSICIDSLEVAFKMYNSTLQEMYKIDQTLQIEHYSINDCWGLATELRSDEAHFINCSGCDLDYFVSINQRTSVSCPFCYNPTKNKANNNNKELALAN